MLFTFLHAKSFFFQVKIQCKWKVWNEWERQHEQDSRWQNQINFCLFFFAIIILLWYYTYTYSHLAVASQFLIKTNASSGKLTAVATLDIYWHKLLAGLIQICAEKMALIRQLKRIWRKKSDFFLRCNSFRKHRF